MESLINAGYFKGILDLTTTEWCDEVVGGVLNAGEERCEAAIRNKVPQVVSVGACDMVNFGPMETVPEEFAARKFYKHNPTVTLMRTTVAENVKIGMKLAEKWTQAEREMTLLLPLQGVSMIDAEGQVFNGPEERQALFNTLKEKIDNPFVKILEMEHNINEDAFAVTAAKELIALMEKA